MSHADQPSTLTLEAPGLRLGLVETGASVTRLDVEGRAGEWTNVVLGHEDPRSYAEGGYLGAVVGRVGNRIDQGRFELDGTTYQIPPTEGPNALHGGPEGFDLRAWALVEHTPHHATWELVSPDGDQGFPGEVRARVRYTLLPGEVHLDYTATATTPTPLNLTNHTYFNLDGEGSHVRGHRLLVEADAFLPTRPDQIPTGEVREVAATPFDLRGPTLLAGPIAADDAQVEIAGGIDHHFVVRGEGMRRHARLEGESGRWLEVWSDRPGVQVYTGAHFDGSIVGSGGQCYGPEAGIALETQGAPDAVNQPHLGEPVLRPGETFASRTRWLLG